MSALQQGLPALTAAWRRHRNRWLDIRFKSDLEASFRDTKIERRRRLTVAGLTAVATLQIAFVLTDQFWLGQRLAVWQASTLLSLVSVPQLFFAMVARRWLGAVHWQWMILALVLWAALALCLILASVPATADGSPPFGWELMMMLVIFTCLFTGLRYFQVLILCPAILLLYLVTQMRVSNDGPALAYAMYFLAAVALLALVGEYLLERAERYEFLFRRRLHRHLEHDFLTGLANRRTLYRALKLGLEMSRRDGRSIAVAIIDVDNFKAFNDKHGHLAGDRYLRRLGMALKDLVRRPLDCTARYGGDEFCVVWYDTDEHGAELLRERIEVAMQRVKPPLSVSIGSVLIPPGKFEEYATGTRSAADLVLEYADDRLYRGKSG